MGKISQIIRKKAYKQDNVSSATLSPLYALKAYVSIILSDDLFKFVFRQLPAVRESSRKQSTNIISQVPTLLLRFY